MRVCIIRACGAFLMKKHLLHLFVLFFLFSACSGGGQESGGGGESGGGTPYPVISVKRNATPVYSGTGPYPFGNVLPGESSNPLVFSIENKGSADLTISAVSITGDNAADFSHDFSESATLAANETIEIKLIFSPTTAIEGYRYAQLNITHNDSNNDSPYTLKLSGYVILKTPEIHVSDSLNNSLLSGSGQKHFGTVIEGASSAAQIFTIQNLGNEVLAVSAVTVSDPANFTLTSSCPANLNPKGSAGSTCTFSIVFNPATAGYKTASVTIASNDLDESSYTFTVTGNASSSAAVAPEINVKAGSTTYLTTSTYDFGDVTELSSSGNKTFTIQNIGTANLSVSDVSAPANPEFIRTVAGLPATITPGASHTFSVRYDPSNLGDDTMVPITISNNDADEASYVINLSGRGTGGRISLTPGSFLNTGVNISSAAQAFVITNDGNAPLIVSTVNLQTGGDFIITSFPAGSIPAGASSSFYVVFKPTALGARNDTLRIYTNDVTHSPSLNTPISGTGVINPVLTLLSAPTTFGSVNVASGSSEQTYTVKNDGTTNLTISAIDFTGAAPGDYSHLGLPPAITPGNTGTFTVSFNPSVTGLRSATINITSNAGVAPIAVSGTGILQDIDVAVSPLFADTTTGSSSALHSILITNTGTDTLNISSTVLSGADDDQFTIVSYPASSLITGGTTNVVLQFNPTRADIYNTTARSATLTITSNAPTPTINITLNANALANPVLSKLAAPTNYGSVENGSSGDPGTYLIRNDGTTNLRISDIGLTGGTQYSLNLAPDFSGFPVPVDIPPGGSRSFSCVFSPTTITNGIADTIAISHLNAIGGTVDDNTNISGNGIASNADLSLILAPTNFGTITLPQSSPTVVFRIKNTGSSNLVLSAINIAGTNPADFTVVPGALPTLLPGQTHDFTVQFTPGAVGARSADITIESNVDDYDFTVYGQGAGTPDIFMSAAPLSFGSIVHTLTDSNIYTIQNNGTADLYISNIVISDTTNFNLPASGPFTIAPSLTQNFSVTYTPTGGGTHLMSISIYSNDSDTPVRVIAVSGSATAPIISLGGSTDFGSISTSSSKTLNFTIFNTGTAPLTITGITTSLAEFSDPLYTGIIAAGASQIISVTFTPSAATAYNAFISIASDDPATPTLSVPIFGSGLNPPLLVTDPTNGSVISFPNTTQGQSSAASVIEVQNNGGSTMTVSSLTFDVGTHFSITGSGSATIPAASSTFISLCFTPSASGAHADKLNIITDGGTSIIDLSGTGLALAPILETNPTSGSTHDFGTVALGNSSAPLVVLIKNTGNAAMNVTDISLASGTHFSLNDSSAFPLVPGDSTFVSITFTPTALVVPDDTLTIDTSGGTNTITLQGAGSAPDITVLPTPHDYGSLPVGSTATNTFTISNGAGLPDLVLYSCILGDTTNYEIVSYPATVIAGGTNSTIIVRFKPQSIGTLNSTLTINSNDPNDPSIPVSLNGIGTGPNIVTPLTISPASVLDQLVGTQSSTEYALKIENSSTTTALSVSGVSISGDDMDDFIITANPFPKAIAATTTDQSFKFRFAPQTTGTKNVSINVYSNDPDTPVTSLVLTPTATKTQVIDDATGGDTSDTGQYASLDIDSSGNLYASYYKLGTPNTLQFAKSTDGGATWSIKTPVTSVHDIGKYSKIRTDGANVYITYYNETASDVYIVRSFNGGTTWQTPYLIEGDGGVGLQVGEWTAFDMEGDYLYVAYYNRTSGDLRIRISDDKGSTWSAAGDIYTVNDVGQYASIYAQGSNVHVAYYDNGNGIYYIGSSNYGAIWGAPILISATANSYNSIIADGSNIYVCYYHSDTTPHVAKSINGGMTFAFDDSLTMTGNTGTYNSMHFDYTGQLHVSYYGNNILYHVYHNTTTWQAAAVAENFATVGQYSSLKTYEDTIYILHYDFSAEKDLVITKSIDAGASW